MFVRSDSLNLVLFCVCQSHWDGSPRSVPYFKLRRIRLRGQRARTRNTRPLPTSRYKLSGWEESSLTNFSFVWPVATAKPL